MIRAAFWRYCSGGDLDDVSALLDKARDFIFYSLTKSLDEKTNHYNRVAVLIPDGEEHLVLVNGHGFEMRNRQLRLPIGSPANPGSIAGKCFVNGEQYYVKDIDKDKDYCQSEANDPRYSSLCCTPIFEGEQCVGVLSIDDTAENAFTDDDRLIMTFFSEVISFTLLGDNWIKLSEEVARGETEQS